jgi:hypothetical protein
MTAYNKSLYPHVALVIYTTPLLRFLIILLPKNKFKEKNTMSTNKNLFKEAIADAKAVREAALINAKAALEEALTPRLQTMLATKLQEMEYEEEGAMGGYMDEEEDMEEGFATDQFGFNKLNDVSENYGSDEDLEEDFDLSEILAELEDEENDLSEAKKGKKDEEDEESEEESVADMSVEDLKELIKSIVTQEIEAEEEETPADEAGEEDYMGPEMSDDEMDSEDEIDLEELLAELDAMDEEDGLEEAKRKKKNSFADFKQKGAHKDNGKLGKKGAAGKASNRIGFKTVNTPENDELMEAVNVIKTLRKELNEQNLLNAKLLYVNKIFKAKNLTESQKVKVIASFDKATTPKEAKIVFESLSSTLRATPARTAIRESLGFASKAAGTAPKKTIVESDAVITRMQKLANIIK